MIQIHFPFQMKKFRFSLLSLTLLLLVSIGAGFSTWAQGIHFEKGLTWQQVQQKAKAENKYIFVDCYTTWCGPCKMMEAEVYPQKEVGDYFNAHFVNVKLQMDQTNHDAPEVKQWYATIKDFEKN